MQKKKNNVIPRNFSRIVAKSLLTSSGGKAGDVWNIYKNDFGLLGLNKTTGKYFYMFPSHLRNKNFFEFLQVDK